MSQQHLLEWLWLRLHLWYFTGFQLSSRVLQEQFRRLLEMPVPLRRLPELQNQLHLLRLWSAEC